MSLFICEKDQHCVDCPRNYPEERCEHWVEVEYVRHAKWVWVKDHWECSACRGKRFHDIALGLDATFCGVCGAKMDMKG